MRFIIMIKSQCVTCVILVAFNFMQVVFKYIYIYSKKNVTQVNSINQWDEILSLGCKNLFWPFNYTWSLIPHDLSWSFLYFLICLEDENCLISTNEIWEFKKKNKFLLIQCWLTGLTCLLLVLGFFPSPFSLLILMIILPIVCFCL